MNKDEIVISCGGIQPDSLEPPMEEISVYPTLHGNENIKEG